MSYLVLARKYRPQTFDEVVRQGHVTQTLANAIAADRVAHAILFSGPRGTGKTTIARILAKAMNCQEGPTASPCNRCDSCHEITAGSAADVFEIDGASNNSVDQVRELRENLRYMPARSRFKIYIIDEVHMLSIAAFNALLKTLEEPPAHVLFFFATTEPHKIPVTILSRCQRHDLKRVALEDLMDHMGYLCKQEGLDIDAESLGLLAREADGSVRDSLSLLDQIMGAADGPVGAQQVLDLLGIVDRKRLFALSGALISGDAGLALATVAEVYGAGQDLIKLYADLLEQFRNLTLAKRGGGALPLLDLPAHEIEQLQSQAAVVSEAHLVQIFEQLFKHEEQLRFASQPKLALECILLQMLQIPPALPLDAVIERLDKVKDACLAAAPAMNAGERASQTPAMALEPAAPATPAMESTPVPPVDTPPQRSADEPIIGPDGPPGPEPPPMGTMATPQSMGAAPLANEPGPAGETPEARWQRIKAVVGNEHPALATHLNRCQLIAGDGDGIILEARGSEFSVKQIQRSKNRQILENLVRRFFGDQSTLRIDARPENNFQELQQQRDREEQIKQEALSHPLVADVIEIFNGKIIDIKIPKEADK